MDSEKANISLKMSKFFFLNFYVYVVNYKGFLQGKNGIKISGIQTEKLSLGLSHFSYIPLKDNYTFKRL